MHKLKNAMIFTLLFVMIYAAINIVPLLVFYFMMVSFYLCTELSLDSVEPVLVFLDHMKPIVAMTTSLGFVVAIGAASASTDTKLFERVVGRGEV